MVDGIIENTKKTICEKTGKVIDKFEKKGKVMENINKFSNKIQQSAEIINKMEVVKNANQNKVVSLGNLVRNKCEQKGNVTTNLGRVSNEITNLMNGMVIKNADLVKQVISKQNFEANLKDDIRDRSKMDNKINQLENERNQYIKKIGDSENYMKAIRADKDKITMERNGVKERVNVLKQEIGRLEEERTEINNECNSKNISDYSAKLTQLENKRNALNSERQPIQLNFNNVGPTEKYNYK